MEMEYTYDMFKFRELVSRRLQVPLNKVTAEAHLANDLGADSLEFVEILMDFEEMFDFFIDDDEAEKLVRVGDWFEYINSHNITSI